VGTVFVQDLCKTGLDTAAYSTSALRKSCRSGAVSQTWGYRGEGAGWGRQAAFSGKLLNAVQPRQAVVLAEKDDRFRGLAASVEATWKAQVGASGWHRTDLEGTASFASDGRALAAAD
jgi:hypothetical protein